MPARVFLGFRLLERLQDLVADRYRVREALQPRCKLFKFVVAEVTVSGAGREDQVIVGKAHSFAVRIADNDTPLVLVQTRDLSKNHRRIEVIPQDSADRRTNLAGRQHRRRHLVQKWLKQMMVRSINQEDLRGRVAKGFGGCQAAEPSADDDDIRL